MNSNFNFRLLLLFMTALISGLPGCDSIQGTGYIDGSWPWYPTDVSVHELTRISRADDEGRRFVEVRVEFRDRDGDPTKACGMLDISISRPGEQEEPWMIQEDLRDPQVSRSHWEGVTGTYLFSLEPTLSGLVPGRRIRVKVEYYGEDGAQFSDTHELTWPE